MLVVADHWRRHLPVDAIGDLLDCLHVAVNGLLDEFRRDELDTLDVAVGFLRIGILVTIARLLPAATYPQFPVHAPTTSPLPYN
jgi:hypothetical protein